MTVYTGEYEAVNGRKPRGTGWWMFQCKVGAEYPTVNYVMTTYGDAKRQAQAWAKKIGGSQLTVLP